MSSTARSPLLWLATTLIMIRLLFPASAIAHPIDEFYEVTYIKMAPNRITLTIELYPGVLVAPQILALVDPNGDETISEAEAQAYVKQFIGDVILEVDEQPVALVGTNFQFSPVLELRAGTGLIQFDLQADLPPAQPGQHQFFYQNNHLSKIGIYVVNMLSDDPKAIQLINQKRDIHQTSLWVDYAISTDTPLDDSPDQAATAVEAPGTIFPNRNRLTGYLYQTELSPWLIVVAMSLSIVLGGLHALTPGHGKTLVAAYLIGSRGTVKHAVALGSIVTFTHTVSVIVIGLLALLASQFIVPHILVPVLEILSGLLVVYLGLRLLLSRWQAYRNGEVDHHHDHDHHHHHHDHDHDHDHDHPHHHHAVPETITVSDLLTLGISGGLVPCPEALGVMLIAIGLNRILLGLGLVVAFSFGLAAILIVIGILLVRSKSLLDRLGGVGTRWQTLLPLLSAVIVTLLGFGIMIKGLLPYLAG